MLPRAQNTKSQYVQIRRTIHFRVNRTQFDTILLWGVFIYFHDNSESSNTRVKPY